jgi:hypothetical protein
MSFVARRGHVNRPPSQEVSSIPAIGRHPVDLVRKDRDVLKEIMAITVVKDGKDVLDGYEAARLHNWGGQVRGPSVGPPAVGCEKIVKDTLASLWAQDAAGTR